MKQVIVVNTDLNMPPGKLAAQVAHASIAAFLKAPKKWQEAWLTGGMPKIVLACSSEDGLEQLRVAGEAANIPTSLIQDAGKTVLPAKTVTCLGLGPAGIAEIDKIAEKLDLL